MRGIASEGLSRQKISFPIKKGVVLCLFLLGVAGISWGQRFLSDYDSTLFMRDTVPNVVRRLENLHFSGYIQPQFQVAGSKGISSFEGGNFGEFVDNRFMLRRARIKVDYLLPTKGSNFPLALFTFQFEATERDVNVRDMFVRLYETRKKNLSLTMGLFARPFGYEVNLSSSYRESPERGRASQILMPSERDLGAMGTFESGKNKKGNRLFKFDVGVFNGQGKSGPSEFDSFKDLISRFILKPFSLGKNFTVSSGLSLLRGGWVETTKYRYEMGQGAAGKTFIVDSSISNIGRKAQRHYYGADAQLSYKHAWGKTELRGEFWTGEQPGTATNTTNPGTLPTSPVYIRKFDAGFVYLLQNIINQKWELVAKWDWLDPNKKISGLEIGKPATNMTTADIKYNTFGVGLTHYFTSNLKVLAYHALVRNEATFLPGYTGDLKDDVFTFRIQLRF